MLNSKLVEQNYLKFSNSKLFLQHTLIFSK